MPDPPVYRSDASTQPRVRPGELPGAIGVLLDGEPMPVGMAFGAGWIGSAEEGTLEACWRLVVRGETIEGRWALLRDGAVIAEVETLVPVSVAAAAVPEPSARTLAGVAGVIGLGVAWRRRKDVA